MWIIVVTEGDTVYSIANQFGVSPEIIIYDNQLPAPYTLAIGQSLLLRENVLQETQNPENILSDFTLSNGIFVPSPSDKRKLYSGGYAYPFISNWVLEQTLPFLSELYLFSYGFTMDGDLISPPLNDSWMVTMARNYNTSPILTLTPFGEDGQFNNELISAVVNNPSARENLKNQIMEHMIKEGFEGLDIDFEYILASDREAFVDFVIYMGEAVRSLGYPVSVALAPKTSAQQTGLLYEGKDYAALGAAADYVLLMAYEWGYTYGPPMAVAPINKVREVIDYAITEIPAEKIHLGIPNYGYDWPLPFVRGETKAQTIGNIQAVQRAVKEGVSIQYDTLAQAPFYMYLKENQAQHEVWFEDVRSMNATFSLIEEYQLRGAGYWNIMQLFRANWLLLQERFYLK